jgi:arsenite/tail-anchored protein-transporting ATPase
MALIDHKLLLFGGKGGVGKTTCAAATALYAAQQGKKTLIVSTDPAHSLADSFDKTFDKKIGSNITNIQPNLDALEIDAPQLLKEYKERYGEMIKKIADEGTFFSKEDIQQFFDLTLPGMDELMALLKIMDLMEDVENGKDGKDGKDKKDGKETSYDLIILDTAPTGHTIRLLELPELMTAYIKVLAEMRQKHRVVVRMMTRRYVKDDADQFVDTMYNDITRLKQTLQDSTKTQFILVTIPEAMGVAETERLLTVLQNHKISIGMLIINKVMQSHCSFCTSRKKDQQKYIASIKKLCTKQPIKELPLLQEEVRGNNIAMIATLMFSKETSVAIDSQKSKKQESTMEALKKSSVKGTTETQSTKLSIPATTQFLLFGGKGGVGKTTCAAATALHLAKTKKVLIFSTDPAHSLGDAFDTKIGNTITNIQKNLDALEIDAATLLKKLKLQYKKEIHSFFSSVLKTSGTATIDAPYDRKVMEDLFDLCPPGIDEIMGLKTMMDLMQQKKYDLFILDTAPSGHTIRLLEMPEIAEQWLTTLLDIQEQYPLSLEIGETLQEMLETLKKVRALLTDAKQTSFVIVSIPEAMSVLETEDLTTALTRLHVPIAGLIINKMVPTSSTTKCAFCSARRTMQDTHVAALQKVKIPVTIVSLAATEIRGKDLNTITSQLL